MGMQKSEVMSVAGPPSWSNRVRSVDRWFYYMVPGDRQTVRVVYFRNGKVFRKGLRDKPALTAEEAEALKHPAPKDQKPFQPSLSEDELRQEIKKEIRKQESKSKKRKLETL